jgi:hypothetical protein
LLETTLGHGRTGLSGETKNIGGHQDGGLCGLILKRQSLYIKVTENALVRVVAVFITGKPDGLARGDDDLSNAGAPCFFRVVERSEESAGRRSQQSGVPQVAEHNCIQLTFGEHYYTQRHVCGGRKSHLQLTVNIDLGELCRVPSKR